MDQQPEYEPFTIIEEPDSKVKNKPKRKRVLLPSYMLLNTRLIIGMVAITGVAVGLAAFSLTTRVETTFIPPVPQMYPSPTAQFAQPEQDWTHHIVALKEEVFGYPAGTLVRINSIWFDDWEQWYNVTAENGTGFDLRESQLTFPNGSNKAIQAQFGHLSKTGLYWLVTTDPVAEIPAGEKVRVDQVWYDAGSATWMYTVASYNSVTPFTAYEWELAYAPDEVPTPYGS